MMLVVADSNDPQRTRKPAQQPDQNALEPIDAEIVDEQPAADPPESRSSGPRDDEEFQQYQQFLEFQKFQEWKRQQGDDVPRSSGPARPWWKKALRLLLFRFVRRLVYLVVVLLLIWGFIGYYFGGHGDHDASDGGGLPANKDPKQPSLGQPTPSLTIIMLHNTVANSPEDACLLMTPQAQAQFATDNGTPDCATAARKLHSQVTDPVRYATPRVADAIVQTPEKASVSSCKIAIEGGPRLGAFDLKQDEKRTWIIDGHQNEPADCTTG